MNHSPKLDFIATYVCMYLSFYLWDTLIHTLAPLITGKTAVSFYCAYVTLYTAIKIFSFTKPHQFVVGMKKHVALCQAFYLGLQAVAVEK